MVVQEDKKRSFWRKYPWLDRLVTFSSFALSVLTEWKNIVGVVSISSFTAYTLLPWQYAVVIPAIILLICGCIFAHRRLINKDNLDSIAAAKMQEKIESAAQKAKELRQSELQKILESIYYHRRTIPEGGRVPDRYKQSLYELSERLKRFDIPCPDPFWLYASRWTLYFSLLVPHLESGDIESAKATLQHVDDIASDTGSPPGELPF